MGLILFSTHLSITLLAQDKGETGREFVTDSLSSFLWIGIILASLRPEGRMPEDKDLLKMPQSEGENTFSQNPR